MAGKKCPNCGNLTFFEKPTGGECNNCGYKMFVPPNEGKGGKGNRCLRCGKYTVFNGVCRNPKCGAKYS